MRKLFSNHYLSGRKIRFMRWSRKGYAAFCSIHRHVTIGQVAKGIADASLSKEKGTQSLNNISLLQRVTAETDTGWLEDRVLHPWWEEKLFCLLWMCEQTGGVAACPAEHIYILIMWKSGICCFVNRLVQVGKSLGRNGRCRSFFDI